ncbi:MAG: hypothetical protein Q9227_009414 [Pyrenula ochraceoflavens]
MFTTHPGSTRSTFAPEPTPLRLSPTLPALPAGGCRFILLHPSVPNQRCSCQGFHQNRNIPGSNCECGHQACYHVHTPVTSRLTPEQSSSQTASNATLLDKVRKLEDALQNERVARQQDFRLQQEELREERRAREREIRIIREALAPFYRSEEEIKRSIVELEDRVEGNYDEQIRMQGRIIALDEATEGIEAKLEGITCRQSRSDSEDVQDTARVQSQIRAPTSSPRGMANGDADSNSTERNSSGIQEPGSFSLRTRRDSDPSGTTLPTSHDQTVTTATVESGSVSEIGTPGLAPVLAPQANDDSHPRSSGLLDLSVLPGFVSNPSETCRSSLGPPPTDLAPSVNSVAAFVQASIPKFTSALAPYDISPSFLYPQSNNLTEHEYIVVGSGAGGGVLAARLALSGHSVLLIEAGDDQGATNLNYTVPAYQARVTEDPLLAWNFFVRHYEDDVRQALDFKLTYDTPDGGEYTGLNPPPGSTIRGVLYPRSATLGGCTAHNALISVYPDRDDFNNIATLTDDASWSADNMRQYFVRLEKNEYLQSLTSPGHGYKGWLGIDVTPPTLITKDLRLVDLIQGAASALSGIYNTVINLASFLAADANADSGSRDSTPALYQIPIASANGARNTVRDFLTSIAGATNADGSKKYPLDIRLNCLVTKVNFDNTTSGALPQATGVSFLEGKSLYRADPRSGVSSGTSGSATASREVIVAGGSYNSPQILKLSGIGPAQELQSFGIPVIKDLPGVGTNLQDHYEVSVQASMPQNFSILDGCTFDESPSDVCLQQWKSGTIAADRGAYAASGFVAAMYIKSSASPDGNYDEFAFGGPVNFRGYFPNYSVNATAPRNWFSWALLKSHPRNNAGTVKLRSADPRDVPEIQFNYFDTGTGDYQADLQTITESIEIARYAFGNQSLPFTEILPGADVQSQEDIESYIKNTAWGHHCSSTCAIGADDDAMAVLDSSFRVRGVEGLRVVDASVYPKIPGTFTLLSTYLVGEKAADVILSGINNQNATKAVKSSKGKR